MMDFGDLQLSLETDTQEVNRRGQEESWAVSEDGSLRHNKTGIQIGEHGLRDGKTSFDVAPEDIEVDQTALLGRGAGGIVAKGSHKPTRTKLAVKVVRIEDKAKRSQLINDLHTLLRMTESSFLIKLYAAYVHKDTGCVHVALEFMDYGSLADVKQRVPLVPEHILAMIMIQILEGLKTLHLSNIVHRDVKLGNILVNSSGSVKVTDFGISKNLNDQDMCDTFVGTATHMSPERVLGEDYSFKADIWSLGLCVFELASGTYPYGSIASFPVLFDNLCNKPAPQLQPGKFSKEVCDFVKKCLIKEPDGRWSTIKLQNHPFIISNLFKVRQDDLVVWLNRIMSRDR